MKKPIEISVVLAWLSTFILTMPYCTGGLVYRLWIREFVSRVADDNAQLFLYVNNFMLSTALLVITSILVAMMANRERAFMVVALIDFLVVMAEFAVQKLWFDCGIRM